MVNVQGGAGSEVGEERKSVEKRRSATYLQDASPFFLKRREWDESETDEKVRKRMNKNRH